MRDKAAELIGRERFLVVHLDFSSRGHYAQAQAGTLPPLPGAGAPYEAPQAADLVLDTSQSSIDKCVEQVLELIRNKKLIR